jgi:hypothetical protein
VGCAVHPRPAERVAASEIARRVRVRVDALVPGRVFTFASCSLRADGPALRHPLPMSPTKH